jgi:hypothetical protein
LNTHPPDLNGNVEENVRALIRTIYGDPREPESGLVARVVRMDRMLTRIFWTINALLGTALVGLIVNVVVLVGGR